MSKTIRDADFAPLSHGLPRGFRALAALPGHEGQEALVVLLACRAADEVRAHARDLLVGSCPASSSST